MLVEPVTESGKSMSLSSQVRLPVNQETAQRDDNICNFL